MIVEDKRVPDALPPGSYQPSGGNASGNYFLIANQMILGLN